MITKKDLKKLGFHYFPFPYTSWQWRIDVKSPVKDNEVYLKYYDNGSLEVYNTSRSYVDVFDKERLIEIMKKEKAIK